MKRYAVQIIEIDTKSLKTRVLHTSELKETETLIDLGDVISDYFIDKKKEKI